MAVFSIFCLEYIYFITIKLKLSRIFLIFFLIFAALSVVVKKNELRIQNSTYKLIKIGLVLICYKLAVDLYHGYGLTECLYESLKHILPLLLLVAFEYYNVTMAEIYKYIILAVIVQFTFGVIQLVDPEFTTVELLKAIPFLGASTEETTEYLIKTSRIVGTFNIGVSYALVLSCFALIFITKNFYENETKDKIKNIILFIGCFLLMLFSGTRASVYATILSILISMIIIDRHLFVVNSKYIIIVSFSIVSLFYYELLYLFPDRLDKVTDSTTISKIGSYIATLDFYFSGVHLFGLFPDEYSQALSNCYIFTYRLFGIPLVPIPYHNLAIRYLVDYGIIGLFIFGYFNYFILKKILNKKRLDIRFLNFSLYIFILLYAMTHNTQIFYTIFFWVILSLGKEKNTHYIKFKI